MSRLPPTLSYLTIYNPTLKPDYPTVDDDDDDADAQAHILFYTSKERAVSRDRILRQVGLAKALVNFAELFNAEEPCSSVHSQTRRMIMVSPEPDFWIHAGIEVARSQRSAPNKTKTKSKDKAKETAQAGTGDAPPVYDYYDGSVHDAAIRTVLLRGYEAFKLTHGSFTQILSRLGQEALELQLERFFTVWAWSLDLEQPLNFGEHLGGTPLHPNHWVVSRLLGTLESDLATASATVFVHPPHVVPSSSYYEHQYPLSLLYHLSTLIPIPLHQVIPSKTGDRFTSTGKDQSSLNQEMRNVIPQQIQSAFRYNTQIKDSRKWYWPSYLTFGRTGSPRLPDYTEKEPPVTVDSKGLAAEQEGEGPQVSSVDTNALEDAMASEGISLSLPSAQSISGGEDRVQSNEPPELHPTDDTSALSQEQLMSDSKMKVSTLSVHLADKNNPLETKRRNIYYCIDGQQLLAAIPKETVEGESVMDVNITATMASHFFNELQKLFNDNDLVSSVDKLPSAAKILQPLDRHVVVREGLTLSDPVFSSQSSHLYDAKTLLDFDYEIAEVFSRGQNPQHWHVGRRGIDSNGEIGQDTDEVYLEVFRKESSLADVDNVLVGIVRLHFPTMTSSSSTEAQLKNEIAKLTASINQRKLSLASQQSNYPYPDRRNAHMNSHYKLSNKYVRPGLNSTTGASASTPPLANHVPAPPSEIKEVVLNGVAFESSGRSLVRKDHMSPVPKPVSAGPSATCAPRSALPQSQPLPRVPIKLRPPNRVYKPKSSRSRNMTLTNNRRPYQSVMLQSHCAFPPLIRFTSQISAILTSHALVSRLLVRTDPVCLSPYLSYSQEYLSISHRLGACTRGLTCPYQHDPAKIAICWNFLQDNCPNTAEGCNLSHEPTPQRTPICMHFLKKGRCTREKCPFPHVNVGERHGICRDFAVLGYCEKGLDCDKQHVRECPDFAERGTCTIKGCKLPHVIRANRNRKTVAPSPTQTSVAPVVAIMDHPEPEKPSPQANITAEDAQLGDEYISLTFHESSDDDSEGDESEDDGDGESDEEVDDPHEVSMV
ncbi:hypothetical protein AMATHDRAFT_46799 [Amanita thiersii Skay4041]|uniref:C3H1-type domain-containing protein n=1 Tax=Amanita thiersii Skay4041 TaxID=703135 RepID=A0A2A9NVV3_9AGAR|nr:hypothetical protein AMATHDRAFT_46799 [Amanita thiersii Skay4041]